MIGRNQAEYDLPEEAPIPKGLGSTAPDGLSSRVRSVQEIIHRRLDMQSALNMVTIDKGVARYVASWLDRQVEIDLMRIVQG